MAAAIFTNFPQILSLSSSIYSKPVGYRAITVGWPFLLPPILLWPVPDGRGKQLWTQE